MCNGWSNCDHIDNISPCACLNISNLLCLPLKTFILKFVEFMNIWAIFSDLVLDSCLTTHFMVGRISFGALVDVWQKGENN